MSERSGVVAVVGNPKVGSRTTSVALAVAEAAAAAGEQVEVIELGALGPALMDWSDPSADELLERLRAARVAVIASPTYKATYTGLLKVFADRIPGGELRGLLAIGVMVGAAPTHSLAVQVHLLPLLAELGCTTLGGLYVLEKELDDIGDRARSWVTGLGVPTIGQT
jgi:FMN reductase